MDKTFNNWSHPNDDRHGQIEFLIKHELKVAEMAKLSPKLAKKIDEEVA
jgi:hypothetical protein